MKRLISVLVVVVVLAVAAVPAFATLVGKDGYEITGEWDAQQLWEMGLFLGADGTFRLDEPLIRTEAAVMLVRLMGAEDTARAQKNSHPFTDVPAWADDYIGYLYQNSLTSGISATAYGSGDIITANQYFTFLLRALGYKDNEDFVWSSATKTALDLNIIGEPCYKDYTTAPVFMRDLAVRASYSAMQAPKKGTSVSLKDSISLPGKPAGAMPVASLYAVQTPETIVTPSAEGAAYISEIESFSLLGDTTIDVKVTCTASGQVYVTAAYGSSSASASTTMEEGKVYTVRFDVSASMGSGVTNISTRTITFSTSSGSKQSSSVFGIAPRISGAKIIAGE